MPSLPSDTAQKYRADYLVLDECFLPQRTTPEEMALYRWSRLFDFQHLIC